MASISSQFRSVSRLIVFAAILVLIKSPQTAAQVRVDQSTGESSLAAYEMQEKARVTASSNDSLPPFLPPMLYDSRGYSPESLVLADLNGDGKSDIVVANMCANNNGGYCAYGRLSGKVGIILGDGDGSFRLSATYSTGGNRAMAVAVADLNGDGKPDVVVANDVTPPFPCTTGCSSLTVLLGNGDGTFRLSGTYITGTQTPYNVVIADVNGDGKPDVIIGGVNSSFVAVLLGMGDGTFLPTVTYESGGAPETVAVADVNGDGKPDIVVADASFVVGFF